MNQPGIITTARTRRLRPALAAVLSLAAAGLGQVYNGDLARGLVIAALRALAPGIAVFTAAARPERPAVAVVVAMAAAWLAITAAAPIDAAVTARRRRQSPERAFTAAPVYAALGLAGALTGFMPAAAMTVFFAVAAVPPTGAPPLAGPGDIVLLNRFAPAGFARGELVRCRDGRILRVIALPGDRVRHTGMLFLVNDTALDLGHVPDRLLPGGRGVVPDDLVSERNGSREYAVVINRQMTPTADVLVPDGSRLLAPDDRRSPRPMALVADGDIQGRVEGILWSPSPRAILRSPWLPTRVR